VFCTNELGGYVCEELAFVSVANHDHEVCAALDLVWGQLVKDEGDLR
jgi:hypothetical protein